jgi:hypothetical protein
MGWCENLKWSPTVRPSRDDREEWGREANGDSPYASMKEG